MSAFHLSDPGVSPSILELLAGHTGRAERDAQLLSLASSAAATTSCSTNNATNKHHHKEVHKPGYNSWASQQNVISVNNTSATASRGRTTYGSGHAWNDPDTVHDSVSDKGPEPGSECATSSRGRITFAPSPSGSGADPALDSMYPVTGPADWPGLQCICALIGAKPEALCARYHNPWFILWVIHGGGMLMNLLVLITYGYGTDWDPLLAGLAGAGAVCTVLLGVQPSRQSKEELEKDGVFHALVRSLTLPMAVP